MEKIAALDFDYWDTIFNIKMIFPTVSDISLFFNLKLFSYFIYEVAIDLPIIVLFLTSTEYLQTILPKVSYLGKIVYVLCVAHKKRFFPSPTKTKGATWLMDESER